MGGYGALRLALGYPDRYCSVNSHSGAVLFPEDRMNIMSAAEHELMFSDKPAGSSHDLRELARKAKAAGVLPRMRIDCGTEDFLLAQNRAFHRSLTEMQVPHEYQEFPGDHTWDYWDLHVRAAIEFHLS